MIVVELSWLSILWVLWLATGADSAQAGQLTFISGCGYFDSVVEGACRQTAAIQAFSFLNWIILMFYTILILVLSIIAASRKHAVWKSSVAEAPFFQGGGGPGSHVAPPTAPSASQHHSVPASVPAGSYDPHSAGAGGYAPQPHGHNASASQGGTGPASVQAGTVHV
ncbi:hypothetical protein C8R47DRAFT_788235 [Mycena vitilis]|nr:hypothetical protein C8R47DRAFT_788235 [Mycena vitilis]